MTVEAGVNDVVGDVLAVVTPTVVVPAVRDRNWRFPT